MLPKRVNPQEAELIAGLYSNFEGSPGLLDNVLIIDDKKSLQW